MSSSSYSNNKSKLQKIVTAVQNAIADLDIGIANTEVIINDFRTFKHSTSDNPRLIDTRAILPFSNLAIIKSFTESYEEQVKAKHKLIRVIDITCGKNNERMASEFV